MRKHEKTKKLAEIRRLIRGKSRQYNLGDELGSLEFWDREDYKRAKKVSQKKVMIGNYPYYSKSTRAIEDLAEEIYKVVERNYKMEDRLKKKGEEYMRAKRALNRIRSRN